MKSVLVVDDMAVFREPLAAVLRNNGYKVTTAKNGAEAMISLDFATPDLILLDLTMPEMDGLTLLGQIRNHPRLMKIPVILLTSSGEKESVLRAKELQVEGYILKTDFSLDKMLEQVRATIG